MATSGSSDFSLTARDIIVFALRKLRVIGAMEEPSADQAEDAMLDLNMMLKGWQKYESLWRMTEGSIALLPSTYSYALSPVPHRVISARYRNASGNDLPMELLTREDYYDLPLKASTGAPTQYYVDYQRAVATLLLWQSLAAVTIETIQYTYLRKFEDIDSLNNEVDVRQEHLEVVGYNLAERLIDDYAVPASTAARIPARAMELLGTALDEDREDFVQFVPGYR